MTRPATPTATPPRLGALISEALDAVHAHAVAVTPSPRFIPAAEYVARWRAASEAGR